MLFSLRPKPAIESLKLTYTRLMNKSFKVALKDLEESDKLQAEAKEVLEKINRIKSST